MGRQVAALASGRTAAALLSALWFVVAARQLTTKEFGSLALLLSLAMMTAFMTDLGMSSLLAREVAGDASVARMAVARVVRTRIVLTLGVVALLGAAYAVGGGVSPILVPLVFAVSLLATTVHTTSAVALRALGRAGVEATNEVLARLFVLLAGSAVLVAGAGLIGAVVVYVVADVISAVVLGRVLAKTTHAERSRTDSIDLRIRSAWTVAASGVASSVYFRLDTWLLSSIKGTAVVARYGAAYRCFEALLLPATAVASLSVPHTATLSGAELRKRLRHLSRVSALVTAPLALVTAVAAGPLLRTVFGPQYAGSAHVLRILAVGAVVSAAIAPLVTPLALRGSRVVRHVLVALGVNFVANLIVIPSAGATGAAVTTVACEALLLVLLNAELRRGAAEESVNVGVKAAS